MKANTAYPAWWPKPNAMEFGGLNVGYWSPNAENWFIHRVEKIRRGEKVTGLQTQTNWKRSIKFYTRKTNGIQSIAAGLAEARFSM